MASRVYRNKKISEYIREHMHCPITGRPNPAPHHLIGYGFGGMGTKAPDYLQMPLCHMLHQELHDKGWKAFEAKYGVCQKEMALSAISEFKHLLSIDVFTEAMEKLE